MVTSKAAVKPVGVYYLNDKPEGMRVTIGANRDASWFDARRNNFLIRIDSSYQAMNILI
jgi:hypothetical protein